MSQFKRPSSTKSDLNRSSSLLLNSVTEFRGTPNEQDNADHDCRSDLGADEDESAVARTKSGDGQRPLMTRAPLRRAKSDMSQFKRSFSTKSNLNRSSSLVLNSVSECRGTPNEQGNADHGCRSNLGADEDKSASKGEWQKRKEVNEQQLAELENSISNFG
jgi:hypothetical protein